MLFQLVKMGFSLDDLSRLSWKTVMRLDRIASGWARVERDCAKASSNPKTNVRKATQADIDNLFL